MRNGHEREFTMETNELKEACDLFRFQYKALERNIMKITALMNCGKITMKPDHRQRTRSSILFEYNGLYNTP